MIAKGTTTIVNFYVIDTDGFPATGQASNITVSISFDGGTATTISATISEKDSTNLPGWYAFEYTFNTAGNAFITFTCSGCIIMPWEEQIVEISVSSAPSASDIANAVWTKDIDSYRYSTTPGMAYKYIKGDSAVLANVSLGIADIPADVWNYSSGRTITNTIPSVADIQSGLATSTALFAVASDVAAVKVKTDNLPASPAATGDIPSVASIQSGLAKTSDLSGLSTLTVNDIPTPPSVEQIQNGLATSANISALQTHGDSHWGISPEGEITVVVDADEIAEAVWNNDERTLTDDISTITAQEIWEYGSRTLTQYGPDISPDEPVGAVYCTPSDVERRWGINNVRQWADLENDGDNAKIQTQIDWAILAASERINSDLAASVYKLPFDPVPYAVRRFAATLAGVELFNTRAVNISREQSNGEIRTALADYSNWITSVLSNVPIVGATLK
ncbi:MAG: DUF1320 family protein [Thermoguttaceae bacterium]|nr:DUF1320 family protein [Thermoguttaceae bacterium]